MISYKAGQWGIRILFRRRGSVFPRAIFWAIPSSANAVLFYWLWFDVIELSTLAQAAAVGTTWASFTFVLGFLVVFRTQQAYSRYWEGATLVQQARANFFNACSTVVSFTTEDKGSKVPVEKFQHLLVRLTSMLHCVGLQTVADMEEVMFEYFNTDGIDTKCLQYLSSKIDRNQRCEVIIQWIQRLVIHAHRTGIVDVPSPLLTRFFQELGQGAVQIINARNMTSIPFPFPYAQMLTALLLLHWILTPLISAVVMQASYSSAALTFVSVFAFWGTNYIAAEIESPFGDDPNDLPLHSLQKDMNKSLWLLLEPLAQQVPKFDFDKEKHRTWDVVCQENFFQAVPSFRTQGKMSRKPSKKVSWINRDNRGGSFESSLVPSLGTRDESFFSEAKNDSIVSSDDTARHGGPAECSVFSFEPKSSKQSSDQQHQYGDESKVQAYLEEVRADLPKHSRSYLEDISDLANRKHSRPYLEDISDLRKLEPLTDSDMFQAAAECVRHLNDFVDIHISRSIDELQRLKQRLASRMSRDENRGHQSPTATLRSGGAERCRSPRSPRRSPEMQKSPQGSKIGDILDLRPKGRTII